MYTSRYPNIGQDCESATQEAIRQASFHTEMREVIMDKICLHSVSESVTTTVSNAFIDYYMPQANGSYVKVYLYLLRCLSNQPEDFSISFLADRLENTEADVLRALKYWEKMGLLSITEDAAHSISSITMTNPATKEVSGKALNTQAELSASKTESIPSVTEASSYHAPERPSYTNAQIAELTNNDEIQWIMNIIEIYLERPLKPKDVQLILYLYDSVGFSAELIMYLYEYCISKGKKNSSYIETVALSWAEQGISSVEQAEEANALFNTNHSAVSKAFGLNRTPGTIEKQYIDKWVSKYSFPIDIIVEACNRTLLNTQKADFKYADKILEIWYTKGVKSPDDIKRLDSEFNANKASKAGNGSTGNTNNSGQAVPSKGSSNRFNAFPQRNYTQEDYAEIEKRMLARR